VQACPKLDLTCGAFVTPVVKSDATGSAKLTIPAGFDGYLTINGGTATVPALWYFSPFPTADGTYRVGLLSPASFQQIASAVGANIDPNAGHAINFAIDCTETYGNTAAGISFGSDKTTGETKAFYLINAVPSITATSTDSAGIGGFANLPTGFVTITATDQANGIKSGSVSTLIRAGTITYAPVAPSP
jgi:hypothetical protein